MGLEQNELTELIERLPLEYKEEVAKLLELIKLNEAWLEVFPPEQQWMLQYSFASSFRALAKEEGHEYVETRKEEPPTLGQNFLELASRRHTATQALETGELVYGSGNENVKGVNTNSAQSILTASHEATRTLLKVLFNTPPDKNILHRSKKGEIDRQFSVLEVLRQVTQHEQRHLDLGRIVFDGARALFPPTYIYAGPQTPKNR